MSGPKNRAPLGAKTTNAKAKAFQTPGPTQQIDLGKTKKASVSGKKPKPKATPAETTKVEKLAVLGDEEDDVPDIEYMPPRSKGTGFAETIGDRVDTSQTFQTYPMTTASAISQCSRQVGL